jgi:chromosome segregation ATPase
MNMENFNSDDIQKLFMENSLLKEKNDELHNKINEMNLIFLSREDDIEILSENQRELQKKISCDAEEIRLLKLKYNECQEEVETMVQVREKLEVDLTKKNGQIIGLKNEIKSLNMLTRDYEDKLDLLEDYIDNLKFEKTKLFVLIDKEQEKVVEVYICCVCFIIFCLVFAFLNDLELYLI